MSIKGSKLDEGKPMSIHRLLYAIKNQNASNSKMCIRDRGLRKLDGNAYRDERDTSCLQ